MNHHSDADLVSICTVDRSPTVWSEFIDRFGTRLTMGIRRAFRKAGILPSPAEMEDLLQEVYCKLLERGSRVLRNCRGQRGPEVRAYLGRVAESVVLDHLRTQFADKRGRDLVVHQRPEQDFEYCELAADRGPSPEDRYLTRERKSLVLSRCRAKSSGGSSRRNLWMFYLAFFEGWTSREISKTLRGRTSPGSVDCTLHRLKKRLAVQGLTLPRR